MTTKIMLIRLGDKKIIVNSFADVIRFTKEYVEKEKRKEKIKKISR